MTTAPAAVTFDPHTALVIVDVQNDFADPRGSLYVSGGEQTIPLINALADAAHAAHALVVYTQDWHPDSTPHFVDQGGKWPPHCVRDTWGAQLHPNLIVDGPVVRKGTGAEDGYSGFTAYDLAADRRQPTGLDDLLRSHGIEHVVVVGLARDVCVKETVLDARRLGYRTTVLIDATRPVSTAPADDQQTTQALVDAGAELR